MKLLETIRANTIAVLTGMPKKKNEWQEGIASALKQAEKDQMENDRLFFSG